MPQRKNKIEDRFPLTLGVLAFYSVAFITEPLLGLSAASAPVVAAYGSVLFGMLLGGITLLILVSLIFTKGFDLIKPDQPFKRYTPQQGLIVAIGFGAVALFQLYVNQAVLSTVLRPAATAVVVDPNTALILKVGSAVSEEALFGAFTVAIFVTALYFGMGRLLAALNAMAAVGGGFVLFHQYTLQAIQDIQGAQAARQAWYFFLAARLILSGVLLATLYYSSRHNNKTASLAAPLIIHLSWNLVS